MEVPEENLALQKNPSAILDRPGKLPCGVRVCVHCHKGCGVAMTAYLSGSEDPEIQESAAKRPQENAPAHWPGRFYSATNTLRQKI
jgi:hypothetical protein